MEQAVQQNDLFGTDNFSRFLNYHRENPQVFKLFEQFALEAIGSGRQHYSARVIMERVRWHTDIRTTGDTFKLNNNHVPFYAKLFMEMYPQHDGFFRTRAAA